MAGGPTKLEFFLLIFSIWENTPTSNELTDFDKIFPKGTYCYRKFCPSLSPILPTTELLLRAEALRVMWY